MSLLPLNELGSACPNQKCLRELFYVIINSAESCPSGISLVIQLCLYVISSGMIAGCVIRLCTFLEQAGKKVLPSTQNGTPLWGRVASTLETLTASVPASSTMPRMEAGHWACGLKQQLLLLRKYWTQPNVATLCRSTRTILSSPITCFKKFETKMNKQVGQMPLFSHVCSPDFPALLPSWDLGLRLPRTALCSVPTHLSSTAPPKLHELPLLRAYPNLETPFLIIPRDVIKEHFTWSPAKTNNLSLWLEKTNNLNWWPQVILYFCSISLLQ